MYDPNRYMEPHDQTRSTNYNVPTSPHHHTSIGPGSVPGPNLDLGLVNDLVEIFPLVQSLIDRKANNSFTRRGPLIYTKTPSRGSKKNDGKNRNAVKSTLKKHSEKDQPKHFKNEIDGSPDDLSVYSANMAAEKDREELNALRKQLENLQQKLLEKDEFIKSTETSENQIISLQSQVDELKRFSAEKDSLTKSSQQQLNDAKIKLADKQAVLEKLQWEAKTSNQKAERLQEELDSMQSHISSLMIIFEGLSKDVPLTPTQDYDISPYNMQHLPEIDDMEEIDMQEMEEARQAYVAAVALAKENQDEESLVAASRARLHLQSFVFRNNQIEEF